MIAMTEAVRQVVAAVDLIMSETEVVDANDGE